jgi:hypothetical protein
MKFHSVFPTTDAKEALASTAAGVRSWQFVGIGEIPSGITLTGGIVGFDVSKTGANQVTITKGITLDSTGTVPLYLEADTAVAIPSAANTISHLFVVKLASTGAITCKAYTTEAGAGSDELITHYRWVGFWRTNGSSECVVALMANGLMSFGKGSENRIGALTTSWATVDHSSFIPTMRIAEIEYGAYDVGGTNGFIEASIDGINSEGLIGLGVESTGDTYAYIWGNYVYSGVGKLPFSPARYFKVLTAGGLLIKVVRVRR